MKQITKFKRLLSGVLSAVMTVSAIPIVSAHADESTEPYPYTMFAASSDDGAITVNAVNFCVNGNVATNGTIVSSGNMNINGTRTEHANESMLYVLKKLNYSYFGGENVETYTEDYVLEDLNININNPIDVDGTIELTGNINLNSGIKAVDDVTINGEVKNSNNAVICSETGDINIETSNVSFNGLIYAPYGDIVIDSDNLNLNNVVIIGQTITIDCPNVNANYSSSMAELIGNQSDVDVELYAMGSYNADVNAIDIEWFTNYTNSSYEVLYSDDNENYTSVATVTDATTYQYLITEDFQKRYFKISLVTNYGEVIESIPFVATKSEDGYEVDFLDSDDDGLPDIYEIMIGTDVNLPDTDSDTLTDYQEIYITGTDPTIYDSVVAGISDADADSDEDGLSNSVEITMGTNPQKADTDDDGLNDSEEGTYNTDPLNPDSDGDTLPDGDEPHIGLDPTNPETFDVPDAEYVVSQTIPANSEALRNINTDDSPYTVSLVVDATGYVEGNLTAKETSYAKAISNDAILGIAPEFSCKKNCDVKQATITFSIKNDYVNNEASAFPDEPELQGLKRFMIFSYIEDMNMLLPVETSYDLENNAIYTNTSGLGTYCIMDMEKWLVNLGIEPDNTLEPLRLQHPLMLSKRMNTFTSDESFSEADTQITHTEEVTETESTDESDTSSTSLPTLKFAPTRLLASKPRGEVTVQNPLDLVFLFQINGDLPSTFESQKEMIIADCEDAFEAYNDVRVYLIGYEINNAKFLKTYNGHTDMNAYCSNIGEVRAALNSVTYVQTSEYCNRGAAFTKMINEVVFRDNAGKFVFQIMNGSTTVNANYFSELDACARGNINYSEVMPSGYHYISSEYGARVNTAITNTGGLNLTYGSDTEVKIYEHIVDNIAPPHIEFNVILPTGWKDISLVDVISPDNYAKSDSDALTDWEEIDTESGLITWDNNGNIQLPTFKKCLEVAADRGYNVINEYNNTVPSYMRSYFYNEEILPIHSNPCDEDSDGDELSDDIDDNALLTDTVLDSENADALILFLYDYFDLVMPPVYKGNGDKISSNNKECQETLTYFETYLWPYLKDVEWSKYGYAENREYLADQQKYAAYVYWLRSAYGMNGLEKFWSYSNGYADALYNEIINIDETFEKAKDQIIKGNYADSVTITGTTGQILLGFTGVDLICDIRDVYYDITHWEFKWKCAGQTAIDSIGLIPVVGIIKNADEIKNIDELMLALKNLDEFSGIIKCTDDIQSQIKTLIRNADTIEEIEKLNQPKLWAKLSTNVGINENLVVLGKYDGGGETSYLSVAKKMNATYFNNPYYDDLEKVITKIDDDAMWKINEEFLSSQTQAGKTIIFSHSPYDSSYTHLNGKPTSFGREIDYLQNSANYKISDVVNADGYYFAVPK